MNQSDLSDRISKLMAEHLLMGHRMLATCCDKCSCILFEDENGKELCIRCGLIDDEMVEPAEPNGTLPSTSATGALPSVSAGDSVPSTLPFQPDQQSKRDGQGCLQEEVFAEVRKVLINEVHLALEEFKVRTRSVSSRLDSLKLLRSLAKTLREFDPALDESSL